MAGNHAIIAPSSLALTVACQAWVQLAKGLPPEPDTPETLEGNAADWVAKQYAAGMEVPYGTPIPLPGDFKVDYDMIHGAKMWADVCGYGAVSGVPVVCERIHPTDCWGEPDGWRWDPIAQRLKLPDYKYGFGIVDVFENWQLIAYAVGLLSTLNLNDWEVMIDFVIVQPRAFHKDGPVRTWTVRADALRALVNIAWNAAVRAHPVVGYGEMGPPPEAKTGLHCVHCPARLVCQTYQQSNTRLVEYIGKMERVAMDENAVGAELAILEDMAELLTGRITALQAQAESYLRAGKRVPNYHMEAGTSRLQWLPGVTPAEVDGLGRVIDKSMRKPEPDINSRTSTVVTPSQAIKAGVDAAVISQYASRPPAGLKLARDTTTEARKAFGATNA